MDITRLYHEGAVEGMVPLAVAKFIALEERIDPRAPDPYDPDACRAMLNWAFEAVTEAFGRAAESLDGLYVEEISPTIEESGVVAWSDAFRDQFTLKHKADALEAIPWLFLPGEGKLAMRRARFWRTERDCRAEGFSRVFRDESRKRGWSISRATRIVSPMASMADLSVLVDRAITSSADRVAYQPALSEIAPQQATRIHPNAFPREPFETWLDCFTQYCGRLSFFAQATEETVSALVLTPQTAQTLFPMDEGDRRELRECVDKARLARETLQRNQYNNEEIDEDALDEVQLDEEMLMTREVGGQLRRYAVLVVPPMPVIGPRAAHALVQLADEGGLILFVGDVPEILGDNGDRGSLRELLDDAIEELGSVKIAGDDWLRALYDWVPPALRIPRRAELLHYRRFTLPEGELALLTNRSDGETFQGAVESPIPGASAFQLDPVTGDRNALVSDDGRALELCIPPGGSSLVLFQRGPAMEGETPASRIIDRIAFTGPFVFFVEGENAYPLNRWDIAEEVPAYTDEYDSILRRRMNTRFWVSGAQRPVRLVGRGFFSERLSVALNGHPLAPRIYGESLACNLTSFLLEGENRLEVITPFPETKSPPSEYGFAVDHPLNAGPQTPQFILLGDFAVIEQDETALLAPPASRIGGGSWTRQGYPYYSGVGIYRLRVTLSSDCENRRLFIRLEDARHAAEVRINEKKAGVIWRAPRRLEITGRLRPGDKMLELRVANTLQNLLGRRRVPSGLLGAVHLEVGERVL